MKHLVVADDLQQLEFNLFLRRKVTFIERERLEFSARDDFDFAFAVQTGLAAPFQALNARVMQAERLFTCSGLILMTE